MWAVLAHVINAEGAGVAVWASRLSVMAQGGVSRSVWEVDCDLE